MLNAIFTSFSQDLPILLYTAVMASGCGSINCWGFSPPINLLKSTTTSKITNTLLIGAGDLRHVLAMVFHLLETDRTESMTEEPLHVYVLEARLEIYARMLLQLYLLSRDSTELSLKEKTEHFLEIHGNLLIRPATKEFIQKCGSDLVKAITDMTNMSSVMPFVDVSLLKYKEVDFLESIFKFWREDKKKQIQLDAKLFWDIRLRQLLGTRYDSQKGAFDWDYNMRLCERDPKVTKLMSPGDYCRWRGTGIGFELREADYTEPNRTLITPTVLADRSGDKTVRYGYWGDVVNSPYLSYILETETEDMDDSGIQPDKAGPGERPYATILAPTIAQKHIAKIVYAWSTGDVNYNPDNTGETNVGTIIEEVATPADGSQSCSISQRLSRLIRIHFLPITAINDLPRKVQFSHLFDTVFISVSLFHTIDRHFCATTFRSGCKIVAETGRYLVELNNEQAKKLNEVISERIVSFGGQSSSNQAQLSNSGKTDTYKSFLFFNYETPVDAELGSETQNDRGSEQQTVDNNNMSITLDIVKNESSK